MVVYGDAQGDLSPWSFERDGRTVSVTPGRGPVFNDADLLVAAALEGFGILYILEELVAAPIAGGRLIRLLEPWCEPFAVYHPITLIVTGRGLTNYSRKRSERLKDAAAAPVRGEPAQQAYLRRRRPEVGRHQGRPIAESDRAVRRSRLARQTTALANGFRPFESSAPVLRCCQVGSLPASAVGPVRTDTEPQRPRDAAKTNITTIDFTLSGNGADFHALKQLKL
ncbi:hypothetical protein NOJ05_29905 [Neorhizobium galegae]|uniref:hypothetical protein n=1 Tax=Neorhizobium galegae TaxID=399 RepID=UPI002102A6EA|nr:hypothetical protein [Neorhizobium galegae]MCQ1781418.1 hypothetical protein [Neorhizobium galegae]MCQ1799222.1 hypothetical protein [Neorhizobium galegae]